jgi:beta-galactosidase/beta-glucuronidase
MELADEIGLMIYDECFASWCLADSQIIEWSEGGFDEMRAKHPDLYFGEEEAILKRWRKATDRMILRDRSHPSVVIWGLLNETRKNSIFREAVKYLPRLRALDKTRVVMLNSGRFDFDMSIGSAANPYSSEWEDSFGIDGGEFTLRLEVKE